VPLVRARGGVEDDHAVIAIAVGHVELVSGTVHVHGGGPAEVRGVAIAAGLLRAPDLEQKLAITRELQYLVIVLAVAAHPHVVGGVDVDAMLGARPLVARAGPAPRLY
jgi:hypothetical protein